MEGLLAEINAKKRSLEAGPSSGEGSKRYKTRGEIEAEQEEEERRKKAEAEERRERLKAETRAVKMRKDVRDMAGLAPRCVVSADVRRLNKLVRMRRLVYPRQAQEAPLQPKRKLSTFHQKSVSDDYD